MPVFCAIYEGQPLPHTPDAHNYGGASIVCWVRATSSTEAAERALAFIGQKSWKTVAVEKEWAEVSKESCPAQSRQYLSQAELDGECYTFHTWTLKPQDDDRIH